METEVAERRDGEMETEVAERRDEEMEKEVDEMVSDEQADVWELPKEVVECRKNKDFIDDGSKKLAEPDDFD